MGHVSVIDIGILKEQVLLVVGKRWEDVEADLARMGAKRRFAAFVKEAMTDPDNAVARAYAAHSGNGTLLVMPAYRRNVKWMALLVHELHHVVHFLAAKRNMADEMEAMAHLQEWLFMSVLGLMEKEAG